MLELLDLWPTKLAKKSLSNCEEENNQLLQLIENWAQRNESLTTDYRDHNPFEVDTPTTNWLRDEVNLAIVE